MWHYRTVLVPDSTFSITTRPLYRTGKGFDGVYLEPTEQPRQSRRLKRLLFPFQTSINFVKKIIHIPYL